LTAPIVQCDVVRKQYGRVPAVAGVSFRLEPGEVLSVLGPSGCGKTTLLRLIAGFEAADSGDIKLLGETVSGPSVHMPPDRRNVGMVFQEFALFPHLTVEENMGFGLHRLPSDERRNRLAEVTDLVGLGNLLERYPHELSGGQQQRVALARTLAPRPIAVLLDEPFSNLDAHMRREISCEVEGILRADGIATMFVTHDREQAFAMGDRVGVMADGRLEQLDTPDTVYHRPATPFVARLAGTSDFLEGRVQGGLASTELGGLRYVSENGALNDGTPVELLVRPDDFRVVPDPDGPGVASFQEFRGDESSLVVTLPSGATLRCRQRSRSDTAIGTRVRLVQEEGASFLAFPN
jgi:iron(III) transport system ATP-binding protein